MNLEYAAGFFDGEGCIGFTKTGSTRRYVPRCHIVNTNRAILEEFKQQFGGYICELKHHRANWKRGWSWALTSRAAVEFLTQIEPFLKIKQEQVWLVWGWDWIRPAHGGPGDGRWDEERNEAMQLIIDQAHWLNQKGPQMRQEPMALQLGQLYL